MMLSKDRDVLVWKRGDGWLDKFLIRVPPEVERNLAVAKQATRVADELAILDPDSNRRILREAARLLGIQDILVGEQDYIKFNVDLGPMAPRAVREAINAGKQG